MINIYDLEGTYTLISAVEKIKTPVNFLSSQFFGTTQTVSTEYVVLEYKKNGRQISPYINSRGKGVDIGRDKAKARMYTPPTFGARRSIGLGDLELRQFGEIPNLYGAPTVEERAAKMIAQDLTDLLRLNENRREQMASELLQTGKLSMKIYASDGRIAAVDELDFDCAGNFVSPLVTWDNPNATIFDDLRAVSERIQENCGVIPTLAICGRNIENYLINNTEIKNWLMLPNRENITMASLQPHFTSPQVRHIGYMNALNMEFVSYSQTYIDEQGSTQYFIDPDSVIIGVPGFGRTVYAPVKIFQDGSWHTISAQNVPKYTYDTHDETTSLTVYSRCVTIPDDIEAWTTLKVVG